MTTTTYTILTSDADLMERFGALQDQGEGEGIGTATNRDGTSTQGIDAAIAEEGWEYVRPLRPDGMALAQDGDDLYVVGDVHGPWAIRVA